MRERGAPLPLEHAKPQRAALRRIVEGLVVVLCAFAAGACSRAPKRPNVVLVSIDTLRADHLGAYGYARPTSPNLDAFAKSAVVFEAAHSTSSWTLPSFASIMTSLLPSTHGCAKITSRLAPDFTTLAEVLRDGGYDTAMAAPHLFMSAQYGLQQGFTHVDDTLIRTAVDSDLAISSPGISDRGLAWIDEKARVQDGVPWMLWLHYFDPHDAYLPHEGFTDQFGTEEIDLYDGEIAFTDHHVGRVLARLDETGLSKDTIVIVISDHGEEFGEHGHRRHGYTLYEEAVRIPLLVRVPGIAPRRVGDVVSNVDVMPTLLELAGLESPAQIEGRSLLSLLRGGPDVPREAVSEVRWHESDDQDMRAVRTGNWKYIEERTRKVSRDLLFDLGNDPREMRDLLADDPQRSSALRDLILRRLARAVHWSRGYPVPERYELSAGDHERLKALGYTGEEDE